MKGKWGLLPYLFKVTDMLRNRQAETKRIVSRDTRCKVKHPTKTDSQEPARVHMPTGSGERP